MKLLKKNAFFFFQKLALFVLFILPLFICFFLCLVHMCANIISPHSMSLRCLKPRTSFVFLLIEFLLFDSFVFATTDYPTLSLRSTLSSLCESNKEGVFGSCCRTYDISSVSIEKSEARDCFVPSLVSTSDGIEYLFVSLFKTIFKCFHVFHHITSRERTYNFG